MWMVTYNPSTRKLPIYDYQHILRLGLWSRKYFGEYFGKSIDDGNVTIADEGLSETMDGHTNDSGNAKTLALSWLAKCMQNADGQHDICNRRHEGYIPTRLLDVKQALQNKVVRLVCLSQDEEELKSTEYASLSNCWGAHGAKQNPKLFTTNIESRQAEGLDWESLPKTFQDTFRIPSWLGLDWLWIDSMCIIQDSQSDWKHEASVMDKVYMNAKVNISADKGEDSRSGFFAQRNKVDITPLHFDATNLDREWIVTTENSFGWMESAPSLSRAWIHRERQLLKPILHFTDKEMIWECCGIGKITNLAFCVVFASMARLVLYLIFKTWENITQTLLYGDLASSREIFLAIIAACMPPYAVLKRVLTKMTTVISTSKTKQDEGSNVTDGSDRLATLVTIGQKTSRGKNITTIHGDRSFERLDDSGSLQGSTDGLYDNGAGDADHKQGKWSKIHVRHEVAVEHTTDNIPMRNL
ncbi:unnamed protein product [Fusarium equiseti]|uniref:Heterokaryon incompatibility domain-containing protein n=1 Tax=Fusarium equiseti TaxID=61235 RepID=A0A8J2NA08_FUSEQ|nr:unnamed protein product [Fusarium equiseti]